MLTQNLNNKRRHNLLSHLVELMSVLKLQVLTTLSLNVSIFFVKNGKQKRLQIFFIWILDMICCNFVDVLMLMILEFQP